MNTNDNANTSNLFADMVVIGAGGSGLTSALVAAEAGVRNVIVLEKTAKPGGNTFLTGDVFAVGSPLQKRLGIDISADDVFREKISHAEWKVDAKLYRNWINRSGDIIRWLENKGIEFKHILVFLQSSLQVAHDCGEPGHPGITGRTIIENLCKECQKLNIKVLCETSGKRILTDPAGEVCGVLAQNKENELNISTRCVVLTTGGFAGNKEMLNKYFPAHSYLRTGSLPQMTGDGMVMAEEAGAIVDDQLALLLVGPGHQGSGSVGMLFRRSEMMMVNKDGERFYDESAHLHYNPDDITNTVNRQREKTCYAMLDSATKQAIIQDDKPLYGVEAMLLSKSWRDTLEAEFQKDAAEGKAMISNSWDEIAEYIGANRDSLKHTIEQYNSFCDRSYDADFLKEKSYLKALRTPPYYVIKGSQSFNTTFGGIKINHHMEVLNKKDISITGLYAAGDNAGSWAPATYSHRYPGSAVSFALCSGYFAGENAAKYLLQKL
jgi:fumarate reductase flavoprotein subunit